MTVLCDRIARAFNKSRATRTMTLVSRAFNMVWHAGLLHKFKTYGIPGPVFDIILSLLNNRLLWVVLDRNSLQEFLKAPLLTIHFSCYTLMTFLMMLSVISLSTLMILLTTLNAMRHLICELVSELESTLWSTVGRSSNWLVDFNTGKSQLVFV